MPATVPVHTKVLYTRPVASLVHEFKVNKHFALEDAEILDLEWLDQQFGFHRSS